MNANRANRRETAEFLTQRGYPMTPAYLARLATRGEGPAFSIWGKVALYDLNEAIEWATRRLAASRRCGAPVAVE